MTGFCGRHKLGWQHLDGADDMLDRLVKCSLIIDRISKDGIDIKKYISPEDDMFAMDICYKLEEAGVY